MYFGMGRRLHGEMIVLFLVVMFIGHCFWLILFLMILFLVDIVFGRYCLLLLLFSDCYVLELYCFRLSFDCLCVLFVQRMLHSDSEWF